MIPSWAAFAAVVVSAGLGCLLSALYIALNTVARAAVEDLAEHQREDQHSKRVASVLDDTTSHARAVGALRVVCDVAVVVSLVLWVTALRGAEIPGPVEAGVGVAIGIVLLWVFGVSVPTSIASYAGARLIYGRVFMLRLMERGVAPLTVVARFFDEVIRRLVGVPVQDEQEQVHAELLSAVEEGEQRGALDEQSREMIEAVMGFGDLTVQQIMTPRTEIEALEFTNNLGAVTQIVRRIGHSRIPVYEESLDQIVGIFYIKDLMKWLAGDGTHGAGRAFEFKSILRPALFVPETKTVRELLREMIEKKVHIAMVADEYGGTAGLVTIEDIFEEIVGDIKDEYEPGPAETLDVVLRVGERRADVDAAARIDEVNDALSALGVEIPESEEYDTVGGFVITTLGRIPAKGESFTHETMTFTILEAKPTRVVKVGLEVRGPEGRADSASPGESTAGRAALPSA